MLTKKIKIKKLIILNTFDIRAVVEIVESNVGILVEEGLGDRGHSDYELATDTCTALTKMAATKKVK